MDILKLELGNPDYDEQADTIISECLNPIHPKSFFLYAGAGSGKTRSLKMALEQFSKTYGANFLHQGKKIAVITYTNAAADEIKNRVGQDSLFPVSTIHSFCWSQIGNYHSDIQSWLNQNLPVELEELREKQAKGRANSQAAKDREKAINKISERLARLKAPQKFTYNPNGDNFGASSLSHTEVLKITAQFIISKEGMKSILVNRFPFILIDESQDTSKVLIEALFTLESQKRNRFALGLFGDTMQRIYADGDPNLDRNIPKEWAQPIKKMNHRCPQRIVQLGNAIRAHADNQFQVARKDRPIGLARLFIANATTRDKYALEKIIRTKMADLTKDPKWKEEGAAVKTLTLEHHMAAARCGFAQMFEVLDKDSSTSTGLRNGELAGLRLFTERIAPLFAFTSRNDRFSIMSHLRNYSPAVTPEMLSNAEDKNDPLRSARRAVEELTALNPKDPSVKFIDVLQCVARHNLFEIPSTLAPFIESENELGSRNSEEEENSTSILSTWRAFLDLSYGQIDAYSEYISNKGPYGTHHGVKGLEFDRVFVILDDVEAKGFSFSYEKLFGAKEVTSYESKRLAEGEEISIDRTRRLLYVTCTRTQKSLAIVAYTDDPDNLERAINKLNWFTADEIEKI